MAFVDPGIGAQTGSDRPDAKAWPRSGSADRGGRPVRRTKERVRSSNLSAASPIIWNRLTRRLVLILLCAVFDRDGFSVHAVDDLLAIPDEIGAVAGTAADVPFGLRYRLASHCRTKVSSRQHAGVCLLLGCVALVAPPSPACGMSNSGSARFRFPHGAVIFSLALAQRWD